MIGWIVSVFARRSEIVAHAPYYKNWSWTLFDFQSFWGRFIRNNEKEKNVYLLLIHQTLRFSSSSWTHLSSAQYGRVDVYFPFFLLSSCTRVRAWFWLDWQTYAFLFLRSSCCHYFAVGLACTSLSVLLTSSTAPREKGWLTAQRFRSRNRLDWGVGVVRVGENVSLRFQRGLQGWRQCDHACGDIKLITKNSEKGRREKGKKKGFQSVLSKDLVVLQLNKVKNCCE